MCRLVIAFVRLIFAAYKSSIHVAMYFFMLSVLVPQLIKSSSISITRSLTTLISSFSLCNYSIRSFLFIKLLHYFIPNSHDIIYIGVLFYSNYSTLDNYLFISHSIKSAAYFIHVLNFLDLDTLLPFIS